MSIKNLSYIREFELDTISTNLYFHQKFEGDVNCVVWDASIVLSKYLEELCRRNKNYLKNLNILELGSGVGCVGMTATCLGANVILTDLPEAIPLLELNIKENENTLRSRGSAKAKSLRWGEPANLELKPNMILLADCVYYRKSIDPLITTFKQLSNGKTKILVAQEMRDFDIQRKHWKYFITKIQESFKVKKIPLEEQNTTFSSPDIVLLELEIV